jgi:hypothetical protein
MGDFRQDDLARLHAREVVILGPVSGVGLPHGGENAAGEGLEHRGAVGKELHPDLVDHVGAAPERQVGAPVVGVAPQRHEAPRLEIVDHVGRGGDRDPVEPAFGERDTLPLRGLEDRSQPHDQCKFPVGLGEGDTDGAFARRLDRRNAGPCVEVAGMPLGAERLVGPDHVLHRHRAAIGEARLGAEGEFHPHVIRIDLHRFGEKPVKREGFVPGPAHERLVGQEAQLPGDRALADMRVETVEGSDLSGNDAPAGGRIGIGVGQMGEIGRQRGRPIHRNSVHRLGQRRSAGGCRAECRAKRESPA